MTALTEAIRTSAAAPWDLFPLRWSHLRPPQRPDQDVSTAVGTLIAGYAGTKLLLGVTPELADLADPIIAVDWSTRMLGRVWPGNTRRRRAIQANWLCLPCQDRTFSAAIGDGSLNCLQYPCDYGHIFAELARTLRPGARLVLRTFIRPEGGESLAALQERTIVGDVTSVHALKWLLAYALCGRTRSPNVQASDIHRTFCRLFPDRDALATLTGWRHDEIAVIDAFEHLESSFSFPTAHELLAMTPAAFSNARLVNTGTYELADWCPLLVADRQP